MFTAMKPTSYKKRSMSVMKMFDEIWKNPDLEKHLRNRTDAEGKKKISMAKHKKDSMGTDAVCKFLLEFGFIETQVSMWRLGEKKDMKKF